MFRMMSFCSKWCIKVSRSGINTLRPRQNGCHLADDTFQRIFLNENVWISTKISLKFAPNVPFNNIPALVQIMAWRRPGDKPLSKPMVVRFPTHICVTRPQWVNICFYQPNRIDHSRWNLALCSHLWMFHINIFLHKGVIWLTRHD